MIHKLLRLSCGEFAYVDGDDHWDCLPYSWQKHQGTRSKVWYAKAKIKGKRIYLHQFIGSRMGLIGQIDHRDLNGLNCTRINLRVATGSQNCANKGAYANNKLGVKGVFYHQQNGNYNAQIKFEGRRIHLGTFSTVEEAAEAYRIASIKYYGEFGRSE